MFKKSKFKEQMEHDLMERSSEVKDLDEGEEKAGAEKNLAERLKAYAEYKRANSEMVKAIGTVIMGAAAVGTFFVEGYKAFNKNRTNEKVMDKQINRMEDWERNVFDNR